MAGKIESCFQITVNGFTAVFQGSSKFSETDEFCETFDSDLSSQNGIRSEVAGSRWGHNPIEETHKDLPYPYCS
jgi:hypothetical protein